MSIKIYLNEARTCVQVVNPTNKFDGDIVGLVDNITGGVHYGYEVMK